jgi:hypothetical protein
MVVVQIVVEVALRRQGASPKAQPGVPATRRYIAQTVPLPILPHRYEI